MRRSEGVWFLDPILDFDESIGNCNGHGQHENVIKFVNNILKRNAKFCDDQQLKCSAVKKFRLCMMRYLAGDAPNVDKWLSFLFERSIEELDISLISREIGDLEYYSVSPETLINAKSLTSLNLESVTIKNMEAYVSSTYESFRERKNVPKADPVSKCLLPSLKTMSIKTVQLVGDALFPLIRESPFIETLSLTSCSEIDFGKGQCICSSSLKLLNIDDCSFTAVRIGAVNLESFRLVSSVLQDLVIDDGVKLKNMSMFAPSLSTLDLCGCHDVVAKLINDVQNIGFMKFEGYFKCKLYLTKQDNYTCQFILLDDFNGESETFKGQWKHFPAMIFPESFRETVNSAFPFVQRIYVAMKNPPKH